MESDTGSEKESSNNKPHPSNILQSARVRCGILSGDRMDQFIRAHRYHLLWHIGLLFWIILPFEEEQS